MKIKTKDFIAEYNKNFNGNTLDFHKHLVRKFGMKPGSYSATYGRIKYLKKIGSLVLEAGVSVEKGTVLTGMSRYHKLNDGGVWVKSDIEKTNQLLTIETAVNNIMEVIKPTEPAAIPKLLDTAMTTFYPLPDLHFGLLIHAEEVSHKYNWDMKISREWLLASMDHLVDASPVSKYAVITDLGDFLHAEDNAARTSSGHQLDTDGKHSRIVQIAFDTMVRLIDKALLKHETIYFYSVSGNHSENSSIYLKAFLGAWYRNEPRFKIYIPHQAQQYHVFGKNILGFSHGHELKPSSAAETLIVDNVEIFSASEFRYFHFGHLHSNTLKEGKLCTVEVHKNIIPRDKWADSMGFRGHIGQAKAIYYHEDYGEVGRSLFNIQMVKQKEI